MCRSYIDLTTREAIAALKDFLKRIGEPEDLTSYDTTMAEKPWSIRATDMARVIGLSKDGSHWGVQLMRWGLIPFFASDIGIGNSATARSTPAARLSRRCRRTSRRSRNDGASATAWVEWREEQPPGANRPFKQPYRIQRADGSPVLFAGLWERNTKALPDQVLLSYTIATCDPEPGSYLARIHDRTPVLIDPENAETWGTASVGDALALLRRYAGQLIAHPIHRDFSNWKTATPASIEPIGPALAEAA